MDDAEAVRTTAVEMLRHIGCEVESAGDGAETIELYRKAQQAGKSIDVVILDLTVAGGMGGKETIKKLLEIDPNVKAVVSSGYSSDKIMSEYSQYGFKGVMPKPFNIEYLSTLVFNLINKG